MQFSASIISVSKACDEIGGEVGCMGRWLSCERETEREGETLV